jgi:cytochrome c
LTGYRLNYKIIILLRFVIYRANRTTDPAVWEARCRSRSSSPIEQENGLQTVTVHGQISTFVHRSGGGDRAGLRDPAQEGNGGSEHQERTRWRKGDVMRKVAVIALVVMVSVAFAASVMAQSAVRDECVALSKDAAKFINEKGVDAAIAEINNKNGKFVTKNTYVFLMNLEGNRLAHPYFPEVKNVFDLKDTTGKLYVQEYIKVAKTKGEGWVKYMYPSPEEMKKPTPFKEKKSSKKVSYVYRIPGKDLMVIAGYSE